MLLVVLLLNVSQDVVEDEVARRLLGENEGLNKLLGNGALGRGLTDDLDDDVFVGGLGVNVGDANFAVLELEGLDAILDTL